LHECLWFAMYEEWRLIHIRIKYGLKVSNIKDRFLWIAHQLGFIRI